ncbi:formate dehydrogenase accessory sulfurtransferase FdhD [Palleronia pelagia]|uniref:Formate dehydrogenase family accessory protein FdhD n=1 Tax=Palleronia pelagia TaxID=387096 RepID=A0A1H8M9S4_9RHOB|nr:formate dehydrogenase accessory sulfurtransferase FdhD [Palleronia pelagia]SEO14079.1 formate dehydrogenase family accessory protein FdhD [Palleronia pelagia]
MAAVGCGLCGIESLEQAARPMARAVDRRAQFTDREIRDAPQALRKRQPEHDRTGASHAAGFYVPGDGIVAVREDVGRHNALDKLIGALARSGIKPASGAIVMTSRISTELVQKCATVGAPTLFSVSAPTDLAVGAARRANITLATGIRAGRPFRLDA